jgi:hypothetical protein
MSLKDFVTGFRNEYSPKQLGPTKKPFRYQSSSEKGKIVAQKVKDLSNKTKEFAQKQYAAYQKRNKSKKKSSSSDYFKELDKRFKI